MKQLMIGVGLMAIAMAVGMTACDVAEATGPLVDNSVKATATATGGNASATGGTHVQTNTQTNVQGQSQTQGQGQLQGQSADNKGNSQSVTIKAPSGLPMNTGVAVAPGLTSGGSQVCLGSFGFGLGGPGATVSFGKTVQDKGCAKRQLYILLFNTGDARSKLVLDSLYKEAMGAEEETKVASAPTIAQAMEQTQAATVVGVQGN